MHKNRWKPPQETKQKTNERKKNQAEKLQSNTKEQLRFLFFCIKKKYIVYKNRDKQKNLFKMSDLDQFAELELSKEDREQIFEPPTDRQHHPADASVPR